MSVQEDGCLVALQEASILVLVEKNYRDILRACLGIVVCTLWRLFYSKYLISRAAREYVDRVHKKHSVEKPSWMQKQSATELEQFSELLERSRKKAKSPNDIKEDVSALAHKYDLNDRDIRHTLQYLEQFCLGEECLDLESKYGEQSWKVLTQGVMMLYGTYFLVFKAPFFWNTRLFWAEWPQTVTREVWVLYHFELAYHGHRALYQPYEHFKSDWIAYVIHHWVTLTLIILSWATGFMKIGAVVMVLHDYSDVFLSGAKFSKYNDWTNLSDMCFFVFAFTWFVCRMGLLAWKVVYSIAVQTLPEFGCRENYRYMFLTLLSSLLLLHTYWGYLIVRTAINRFRTKSLDDVRSDDECEKE